MRRILLAALTILVLTTATQAAKVKVWHHYSQAHQEKAQLKNAVVTSEGELRLSRQLKPLAGIEASHVWDVVEDAAGNLYAATGDDGKLYKITPDGKASVAFTSEDSEIFSLAVAADGSVYAGTGPSGHVIRIDPRGEAKVIAHLEDGYVWSLAVDPKGETIYAGTGPRGRIYKLTPDGKPSVYYTTKQEHILCIALGADGNLYAGTDKGGLVYRIDGRGKGFVLFSAPQSEVRCLLVTNDGIYAGTAAPTRRRGSGPTAGTGGGSNSSLSGPSASPVSTTKPLKTAEGTSTSTSSSDTKETKSSPAPAPSSPGNGENSLFRIAPDGTVREVFREKALVLSLLREKGWLLIGTGMEGQLFEVEEGSKERSEIARLEHGQILKLLKRRDGSVILATGDPGKLYVLHDKFAARGSVTSEVLDAKMISKWGALRWKADTPAGTAVTVAVRSGNTSDPDDTWSDWSAEMTDAAKATVTAPTARFLQYRLTLTSDNAVATPVVHGVTVRYMTTNAAPEVTKIEVPDIDGGNLDDPKKLKFKWAATDANEDDLGYSVFVKKEGWKNWVLLEENLTRTDYEWDTTTTPSGIYQLKVVASDRKDNSPEDALTGEKASGPFVVSHTPPGVTVKVVGIEGDQAVVEATATDPLARITSASFAVNGKKWLSVFPADGLFDDKTETFRFKTETLKPGTYVLVLRVKDAAGNTGSGDVVFTVTAR